MLEGISTIKHFFWWWIFKWFLTVSKFPFCNIPKLKYVCSMFQVDVIGIDEAQFFEDLYEFCCKAADHDGKTVIVAGLDGDYLRYCFTTLSSRMFTLLFLGHSIFVPLHASRHVQCLVYSCVFGKQNVWRYIHPLCACVWDRECTTLGHH